MAKFEVATVYFNITVHPEDRYLLGTKRKSMYYVAMAPSFGLRSAPLLSPLLRIWWNGPWLTIMYSWFLASLFGWLPHMGTPCVWPFPDQFRHLSAALFGSLATTLGTERDCEAPGPSPPGKAYIALVEVWFLKQFCKRKELESLIGHLH